MCIPFFSIVVACCITVKVLTSREDEELRWEKEKEKGKGGNIVQSKAK